MIEVNNVSKRFLITKSLDNCSIKLETGKIIGIIGENGSGKTTLLKLLSGLLRPSSGDVLIDSEKVTRRISSKLAYLTDADYYFPYFTIEELIRYYESQFADFDTEKALQIIDFMKLKLEQKIKYLSKGNRNRLKIAVTLSRNAPYILLDEPFSGLDPLVRKAILKGMIQFVDLSTQTVLITTHEIKEVEPILDEVVLLRDGRVLVKQSVEEIREAYGLDIVSWMEKVYEKGDI
ncbi:ATP-binding cassette domain-containing protein [Ornithinibacillus halophilus]|uniref:ABC-2 type transport system ATP-binding protein n=1 Tax=Ornithinibacillus halophilus TaxID=930117 RepID=A0A1M5NBE1_9BACI|nr:ABC transporter ATP-binding protein [Ornithinibacillus halophilus]SHG86874.1 ABC-2 type transport system ATP-binding protein [Ornithinibacillus halophilus]